MKFQHYCQLKDKKLDLGYKLHVATPIDKVLLKREILQIDELTILYEDLYRTAWALKRVC